MGILRRASERGKALPPKLERALKIQAGLMCPDGQPTDLNAFHINQRDEGIDLHGVSGALMATTNMQMQTFINGDSVVFAANQREKVNCRKAARDAPLESSLRSHTCDPQSMFCQVHALTKHGFHLLF